MKVSLSLPLFGLSKNGVNIFRILERVKILIIFYENLSDSLIVNINNKFYII